MRNPGFWEGNWHAQGPAATPGYHRHLQEPKCMLSPACGQLTDSSAAPLPPSRDSPTLQAEARTQQSTLYPPAPRQPTHLLRKPQPWEANLWPLPSPQDAHEVADTTGGHRTPGLRAPAQTSPEGRGPGSSEWSMLSPSAPSPSAQPPGSGTSCWLSSFRLKLRKQTSSQSHSSS